MPQEATTMIQLIRIIVLAAALVVLCSTVQAMLLRDKMDKSDLWLKHLYYDGPIREHKSPIMEALYNFRTNQDPILNQIQNRMEPMSSIRILDDSNQRTLLSPMHHHSKSKRIYNPPISTNENIEDEDETYPVIQLFRKQSSPIEQWLNNFFPSEDAKSSQGRSLPKDEKKPTDLFSDNILPQIITIEVIHSTPDINNNNHEESLNNFPETIMTPISQKSSSTPSQTELEYDDEDQNLFETPYLLTDYDSTPTLGMTDSFPIESQPPSVRKPRVDNSKPARIPSFDSQNDIMNNIMSQMIGSFDEDDSISNDTPSQFDNFPVFFTSDSSPKLSPPMFDTVNDPSEKLLKGMMMKEPSKLSAQNHAAPEAKQLPIVKSYHYSHQFTVPLPRKVFSRVSLHREEPLLLGTPDIYPGLANTETVTEYPHQDILPSSDPGLQFPNIFHPIHSQGDNNVVQGDSFPILFPNFNQPQEPFRFPSRLSPIPIQASANVNTNHHHRHHHHQKHLSSINLKNIEKGSTGQSKNSKVEENPITSSFPLNNIQQVSQHPMFQNVFPFSNVPNTGNTEPISNNIPFNSFPSRFNRQDFVSGPTNQDNLQA